MIVHAEFKFASRRVEVDCERLRRLAERQLVKIEQATQERRKRINAMLQSIEADARASAHDLLPSDCEPAA